MEAPGTAGRIPATKKIVAGAFHTLAKTWLMRATAKVETKAAIILEDACSTIR